MKCLANPRESYYAEYVKAIQSVLKDEFAYFKGKVYDMISHDQETTGTEE